MDNILIKRTDSSNTDFQNLVKFLDADLAVRDGEEHAFYHSSIELMLFNIVLSFILMRLQLHVELLNLFQKILLRSKECTLILKKES
jgi:hypothetical protein